MLSTPDMLTGQPEGAPPAPDLPDLPDLTHDELHVACALIGLGAATSPLAIAADLGGGMGPHQFLATLNRTHVRRWIEAALAAEDIRIELIAKRAKADALDTLATITRDNAVDPIERRRAASAVLRALARPSDEWGGIASRRQRRPDAIDEWGGIASRRRPRPDAGAAERSESVPAAPDPREAEQAHAAERARERQLQQWHADADDIRRRLDFTTTEAAAQSVAKIITTADPGDFDAALHALFLITSFNVNYRRPEKFARHTRYLMRAAGGHLAHFEFLRSSGVWDCFRVVLQPPKGAEDTEAEPLDLAMWFTTSRMSGSDGPCSLWAIVPWEEDNWRHPGNTSQVAFHLVDPLHPPHPPDPPTPVPPRGHLPPAPRDAIPGPAPP
jgi:hypothetical protein